MNSRSYKALKFQIPKLAAGGCSNRARLGLGGFLFGFFIVSKNWSLACVGVPLTVFHLLYQAFLFPRSPAPRALPAFPGACLLKVLPWVMVFPDNRLFDVIRNGALTWPGLAVAAWPLAAEKPEVEPVIFLISA